MYHCISREISPLFPTILNSTGRSSLYCLGCCGGWEGQDPVPCHTDIMWKLLPITLALLCKGSHPFAARAVKRGFDAPRLAVPCLCPCDVTANLSQERPQKQSEERLRGCSSTTSNFQNSARLSVNSRILQSFRGGGNISTGLSRRVADVPVGDETSGPTWRNTAVVGNLVVWTAIMGGITGWSVSGPGFGHGKYTEAG